MHVLLREAEPRSLGLFLGCGYWRTLVLVLATAVCDSLQWLSCTLSKLLRPRASVLSSRELPGDLGL